MIRSDLILLPIKRIYQDTLSYGVTNSQFFNIRKNSIKILSFKQCGLLFNQTLHLFDKVFLFQGIIILIEENSHFLLLHIIIDPPQASAEIQRSGNIQHINIYLQVFTGT